MHQLETLGVGNPAPDSFVTSSRCLLVTTKLVSRPWGTGVAVSATANITTRNATKQNSLEVLTRLTFSSEDSRTSQTCGEGELLLKSP